MGLYDSDYGYTGAPYEVAMNRGYTSGPVAPVVSSRDPSALIPQSGSSQAQSYTDISEMHKLGWDQMRAIQAQLERLGVLGSDYNRGFLDESTEAALESVIPTAVKYDMTLPEYLMTAGGGGEDGYYSGDGSGGYGSGSSGPTTYTSTSVSLTGRPTARSVLKQALQTWMGRAPTGKEVDNFLKGLNKAERDNPSVTTTTTDTEGNSTSTSKGGNIDPYAKAEGYVEKDANIDQKEAKKYQTANYMTVLDSMLGM